MIEQQQNNPLHGLKLETMITELVDFYDWKILYAALRLECFHLNPSLAACIKFLKKTEWARERVENFYLYRFKRMPKATAAQFELKARERGFEDGIMPRKPQALSLEMVAQMRAKATADYESMNNSKGSSRFKKGDRPSSNAASSRAKRANPSQDPDNPWGK
ncbi:VF530 family protein [Shewanella surugensis]|uniref:VF530 family DNA-binding protein n=1 Tax=Shewanella surugensis TaxID=212020 RepID=A0ABT0LHX2_9GAMM|nr:VF530 family DNA-binding protein [Shewanella surugensis]MCL1127289.1 VF530 family DNA-binding protein [Shewanella surugensis]